MNNPHLAKIVLRALPMAVVLALVLGISPALAARDRTPPTTPTNLHVTAVTSYSVSLAWNPSADNSGSITYKICCATTSSGTVSHPTTSFTFTTGVEPGWTHSFRVFAVDAAGNKSGYSNSVTVTTPPDTTSPTAPVLSVTGIGSTYVSLSWTQSIDDGPYVWYRVLLNGSLHTYISVANTTSTNLVGLTPSTPYFLNVQAIDSRGHLSPISNTVTVTTEPSANDTVPPTTPASLTGYDQGDGEAVLRWTQSTDNLDPQFAIRYEISVNGVFRPESTVIGYGGTIAYAVVEGFNTFEVVAIDSAGNRSAPAAITLCMAAVCN